MRELSNGVVARPGGNLYARGLRARTRVIDRIWVVFTREVTQIGFRSGVLEEVQNGNKLILAGGCIVPWVQACVGGHFLTSLIFVSQSNIQANSLLCVYHLYCIVITSV